MQVEKEFLIVTAFSCFLVFNLTKNTYSLLGKLQVLENNLSSLKERINDLELFKLKVYNHEIVPGRRAWDDFDIDMEEEEID